MIAASIYFLDSFENDKNDVEYSNHLGLPLGNYRSRKRILLLFLEDNTFTEENYLTWLHEYNENESKGSNIHNKKVSHK